MAKKESIQEDQEFTNTVEMFYRKLYTKEWVIGEGAYLDLAHRVENLEDTMRHGISPFIRYMMGLLRQYYEERDTIPGAASAAYEWQSQLREVTNTVENMLEVFDDLEKRLSCYVDLTKQVSELLKLARTMGNRNVRDAVLTLHDALRGTYSEDLTNTQVEAMQNAINHLYDLNLTREQVRALDRELRNSGLETIPSDKFVGMHSEQHSA